MTDIVCPTNKRRNTLSGARGIASFYFFGRNADLDPRSTSRHLDQQKTPPKLAHLRGLRGVSVFLPISAKYHKIILNITE